MPFTMSTDSAQKFNFFKNIHPGEHLVVEMPVHKLCIPFPFHSTDRILLNGYQSWTDTQELTVFDKMRGVTHIPKFLREKYAFDQYGDYTFVEYGKKKGQLHGWSYGYIRRGDVFYFIGSLNENEGFTLLQADTHSKRIFIQKDLEGGDQKIPLHLFLAVGTENQVFDEYFRALGIPTCQERNIEPLFGYTSWYRHYQDISEQKILADLDGLSALPKACNVFQVDDGYQHAVGDWLEINSTKFPNGMTTIAETIASKNLIPGLWLAPFACEKNSHLFQQHPEWLVHDDSGKPVVGGGNWSGFYALDFYHPEVQTYLKEVLHTVVHEWGFKLLKLDFLYAVCIEPRAGKNRGQIMYDAMKFLSDCVHGEAQILACGVPLASAFGLVEYCRIGCDVSLSYNDVWYMRPMHRERPSTKNTLHNTLYRRQLDGRAFLNDPDVFLLRDTNIQLTQTQRQTLAEINALCGNVIFTSDDASKYQENAHETFSEMMDLREWDVIKVEPNNSEVLLTLRHREHPEMIKEKRYVL